MVKKGGKTKLIFKIYWGTVSWGGGVVPGKLADLVLFLSFYSGLTPYGSDASGVDLGVSVAVSVTLPLESLSIPPTQLV